MQRFAVAAALAMTWAMTAVAQPMIDRVPEEALAYIGWSGAGGAEGAYAASVTAKVVEAANLQQSVDRLFEAVRKVAENEGDAETLHAVQTARAVAEAAWRDPFALYVLPPTADADEPRVVMLWRPGADNAPLVEQLRELAGSPDARKESAFVEQDGLVQFVIGTGADEVPLQLPPRSLSASEAFSSAVTQVGGDGSVVLVYVNLEAVVAAVDAAAPQQRAQRWQAVKSALGLDRMKQLVFAGRFTDPGRWQTQLFIGATQWTGLPAAMLGGEPVGPELLRQTPPTATWLWAMRLDTTKILNELRATVTQIDPEQGQDFDEALTSLAEQTGVDLEDDLLASLGTGWAMYSDPAVAGPGGLGIVLVSPLRDAAAAEKALTTLESLANRAMAGQGLGEAEARFQTTTYGELTIHSLVTPIFAPSWTVANGNLYVALLPQAIMVADDYASSGERSIIDNEKYQQILNQLSDRPATSITFIDLRQTAPPMYQQLMMLTQMASGLVATRAPGVSLPMLVPPLGRILPYLEPAGRLGWMDEAGYHSRSISPFIGSTLLSPQAVFSSSTTAMGVGILLPALTSARVTARAMQASTQLRGIHQGSVMWAQSHRDAKGKVGLMSSDVGELYEGNYFPAEYVLSPNGDGLPRDFEQWPMEQRINWVRQNTTYILVPGLVDDLDTDRIAGFGIPEDHDGNSIPVVYNDNHVERERDIEKIRRLLREQNDGMTMEQMIQRQRSLAQ